MWVGLGWGLGWGGLGSAGGGVGWGMESGVGCGGVGKVGWGGESGEWGGWGGVGEGGVLRLRVYVHILLATTIYDLRTTLYVISSSTFNF